ncbi:MAG: hypothetical protein J6M34_02295 [Clostridia bacterium]|nr:hypothetical protein [Clostridia bacterium]
MTDKDFEKLFKESKEITPRADLKNEILAKTKQEMETSAIRKERKSPRRSPLAKRLMPIAACFVFVFILIGGMLGLENENYQTVYIDVNPSVALNVNRFGKVSSVEYLNEDAKEALNGIKLKGLSAEDALEKMITAYDNEGYFNSNAEIYISAASEKNKNADKLLAKLSERAEKIKGNRNYSVNTTKLTAEDRTEANEYGISPGKYRVIEQVIEKHPNYTVEELKDMSMAELKELLTKDKGNKK